MSDLVSFVLQFSVHEEGMNDAGFMVVIAMQEGSCNKYEHFG